MDKDTINRIIQAGESLAPFLERLNSVNKTLETLEPVRKQMEKVQELIPWNKEKKNKSTLWYFKNEILEYSEPTSKIALNFLSDTLNKLRDNKERAEKIFKGCIYTALKRERERSIGDTVLQSFISSEGVESVYLLLNGNISPRESKIIISYLCVYVGFIQNSIQDVKVKTNINNDICIIRTNRNYQKLAMDAQKTIIRELANERTDYRIEKILRNELSLKYKHIPSENTLKNWINVIKKHLKESCGKQ
ncbi:hypothetical protein C3U77_000145 [Escherichia coli]|nr:hypothetical protein [Escherichia coli]EFA7784734.1 hypothetical protein [Escherichia coli]EFA7789010.1 hypothetical protein [Escherichia coli]EFA7796219.1 hypothetical protein [Escherichia coli]EFA7811960.1 hypothetical protein [Escherichia coli]